MNSENVSNHDPLPFLEPEYVSSRSYQKDEFCIYYIGNSITRHGFNQKTLEKLGWGRVCGMAASCEENDYAHILAAKIQNFIPEKKVVMLFGSLAEFNKSAPPINPGLVVFQSGEHVTNSNLPSFAEEYTNILSKIRNTYPDSRIIAIGVWNPRCREEFKECTGENYFSNAALIGNIQKTVAKQLNIPFVSVSEYENDPANTGNGVVAAVRWHPNDNGMKCYADAAFSVFKSIWTTKE